MPLRAMYGDANVFAYECDTVQWAELKTSYKTKKLTMPCCGNGAIPKTSRLGTFFFSHTRKGECTTAPESAEHIYVKTLIAKAAVSAGWSVATEWPGETPDGEKWIADASHWKCKCLIRPPVKCVSGSNILKKIQRNPDNEKLGSTVFLKDEGHGAWYFN